jgi:hypothetical protein
VQQIRGINGIGGAKAGAIHQKLVAAAWHVTVLPHLPGRDSECGDSEPPVLATPLDPDSNPRPSKASRTPAKQPLKRWTEEEDRLILEMRKQGQTWPDIAAILKRSLAALRTRWSQTLKPALVAEGRASEAAGAPLADLDAVQWDSVAQAGDAPMNDAGEARLEAAPSFLESEVD